MLYKQQNQQYPEPQQELSTYGNLYPYYANKEYINSPIYRNFLNSIQAPKTKAGYEHKLNIIYQYLQNDYFKKSDPKHASIPNLLWRSWELDLINSNNNDNSISIIVSSKIISEELNYFDKDANVFVVSNYPSYQEIKDIPEPDTDHENYNLSSAFTSRNKPTRGKTLPIQNTDNFIISLTLAMVQA